MKKIKPIGIQEIDSLLNNRRIELSEEQEYKIHEVLSQMDFIKIHQVMQYLEWGWLNAGVPSVEEIRTKAYELMRDTYLENLLSISCGGFVVRRDPETDELDVVFYVTHGYSDVE